MGEVINFIPDEFFVKGMKFFSQRDNKIDPMKTCFPTSISMLISQRLYPLPVIDNLDDVIISDVEKNLPVYKKWNVKHLGAWAWNWHPRYLFGFWIYYCNLKYGIPLKLRETMTAAEILSSVQDNRPVIANTHCTKSGHIMPIVGANKKTGKLYVNDPFGVYPYKDTAASGERIAYPAALVMKGPYLEVKK